MAEKAKVYLGNQIAAEVTIRDDGVVTLPLWLHALCRGATITITYNVRPSARPKRRRGPRCRRQPARAFD